MSVEQMRNAIETVYPGPKWKNKVNRMSDAQIVAVYHKFLREDRFKSNAKKAIS